MVIPFVHGELVEQPPEDFSLSLKRDASVLQCKFRDDRLDLGLDIRHGRDGRVHASFHDAGPVRGIVILRVREIEMVLGCIHGFRASHHGLFGEFQ